MEKSPQFHGSDLEKIEAFYHIPKEEILPFGANVNPLGLSESVKKDLAAHLDILTRYPDRDYKSLKETISVYVHCRPEQVVVGNGSTELISLLISGLAPKQALILGPTYAEYERELSLAGSEMILYPLREEDDFALDVDDFLSHITGDISLVILCNPNNPTSSALTVAELEKIIAECKKRDVFLMIDETYVEFAPDPDVLSAIPLAERYDNFMVIRGVSKFFSAPGLRFGYGITGNDAFIASLKLRQNPWSLSSIGAYAGEKLLKDTAYIEESKKLISSERSRIRDVLTECPSYKTYPAYANFFLVRILKEGVTSFAVFEKAIRDHCMIRDCSSFDSLQGEYIRFCILKPEENDRLLTCLTEI